MAEQSDAFKQLDAVGKSRYNEKLDAHLVPSHIRPAPDLILVLLNDILVLCVKCNREMKARSYEGHEGTSCLTASEERTAAGFLKRAVSTSPDKANDIHAGDQIPPTHHSSQFKDFEDQVLRNADDTQCSQCRRANSPYIQREVLTLSDDERRALLDKAGILSTIEIGAAETLAIKAGLAIPWNN
ncbi:hypothetical protein EMCRGX_G014762 [Ephydatia muelleri]|eukprot:Em0005g1226a